MSWFGSAYDYFIGVSEEMQYNQAMGYMNQLEEENLIADNAIMQQQVHVPQYEPVSEEALAQSRQVMALASAWNPSNSVYGQAETVLEQMPLVQRSMDTYERGMAALEETQNNIAYAGKVIKYGSLGLAGIVGGNYILPKIYRVMHPGESAANQDQAGTHWHLF